MAGRYRLSLYHAEAVLVHHPETGEELTAIGAGVGAKGQEPSTTILMLVDRPEAIVCESARQWLNANGQNSWPSDDAEIGLGAG